MTILSHCTHQNLEVQCVKCIAAAKDSEGNSKIAKDKCLVGNSF